MEIDFAKLRAEALKSMEIGKISAQTEFYYNKSIEEGRTHAEAVAMSAATSATSFVGDIVEKMFELYHQELIKKLNKQAP